MLDFPSGITYFYNSRQPSAVSFQLLRFCEAVGIKAGGSFI